MAETNVIDLMLNMQTETRDHFVRLHQRADSINGRLRATEIRLVELSHLEGTVAGLRRDLDPLLKLEQQALGIAWMVRIGSGSGVVALVLWAIQMLRTGFGP